MQRKYLCLCNAAITLLLFQVMVSAQVGRLSGHVQIRIANGEELPLEGAEVVVFRTDLPGKYRTTTAKTGTFVFAGLPYVGVYLLAISAPNARAEAISNVKAGREIEYKIVLESGDGKSLTLDEAKDRVSGPPFNSTEASSDRRRVETYYEVSRAFKAGNTALFAKKYDEAIKHYDEGITMVPYYPDLQPALWTNKSVAFRTRGVESYNTALNSKTESSKTAKLDDAKEDFQQAADAAARALEILNLQPIPTDMVGLQKFETDRYHALVSRAEALRLLVKFDPGQASAGFLAFQEYIQIETNPFKRSRARFDAATMLLDAEQIPQAIEEFQKILFDEPDNLETILGVGMALYKSGDKSRLSEAEHYLRRFLNNSPATHVMRNSAVEILKKLKSSK